MITLGALANEIAQIRDALDIAEVKGEANRACLSFAYNKCNTLINIINDTAKEISESKKEDTNSEG